MMPAWAIAVDAADAAVLGGLRTVAGLGVCAHGAQVWIRGPEVDADFAARLRQVPGAWRYRLLPDGQLLPDGYRVPVGSLPDGPWQPLKEWLRPCLPPPARPVVRPPDAVALTLVRSTEELPADMLLTSATAWSDYAATAPAARLANWSFARDGGARQAGDHDDGGRVLVRGRPLPPLRGTRLVDREGIAVPAGWTWLPAVEPAVLRASLGLDAGDVALFDHLGAWQRVAAADWARATRSAIRRTEREDAHAR